MPTQHAAELTNYDRNYDQPRPAKRAKAYRACDRCIASKTRCDDHTDFGCSQCIKLNKDCSLKHAVHGAHASISVATLDRERIAELKDSTTRGDVDERAVDRNCLIWSSRQACHSIDHTTRGWRVRRIASRALFCLDGRCRRFLSLGVQRAAVGRLRQERLPMCHRPGAYHSCRVWKSLSKVRNPVTNSAVAAVCHARPRASAHD